MAAGLAVKTAKSRICISENGFVWLKMNDKNFIHIDLAQAKVGMHLGGRQGFTYNPLHPNKEFAMKEESQPATQRRFADTFPKI